MSVNIEVDLKDILGQINQKLDNVQKDVTDIKLEISEFKGDIKRLDEKIHSLEKRLDEKIDGLGKRLEEKIDGLGKRLDNQEFVSRGILVALIVAILGGLAKLFGWVGNS
jgi:peptidoglycan hydrolase CwlO-like protein